jgi:predicted PurR-regulated permease PerM
MTPEMIAILSVGVALAGLVVTFIVRIDKRFEQLETRNERRFQQLEASIRESEQRLDVRIASLDTKIVALDSRVAVLERGQARLEGLLDGIREALFGRAPAGPR